MPIKNGSIEKYNEIAEYIRLEQPFSPLEICEAFKCSRALPYALLKEGFIKWVENKKMLATETGKTLTGEDIYLANVKYISQSPYTLKRKDKIKPTIFPEKVLSPVEFLRLSKGNDCKNMAAEILQIIKKYVDQLQNSQ